MTEATTEARMTRQNAMTALELGLVSVEEMARLLDLLHEVEREEREADEKKGSETSCADR